MVVEVNGKNTIVFILITADNMVVYSGRDVWEEVLANRVKVDKGRIPLQSSTIERFGSSAAGDLPAWLFVVDAGHFRVFSRQEIGEMIDFNEFDQVDVLSLETQEERMRVVGSRLRLIATSIVPDRRLKIPSAAFDVSGEDLDRTHLWLEQSPSQLDVYTATYVQKRLGEPPSKYLPAIFPT